METRGEGLARSPGCGEGTCVTSHGKVTPQRHDVTPRKERLRLDTVTTPVTSSAESETRGRRRNDPDSRMATRAVRNLAGTVLILKHETLQDLHPTIHSTIGNSTVTSNSKSTSNRAMTLMNMVEINKCCTRRTLKSK